MELKRYEVGTGRESTEGSVVLYADAQAALAEKQTMLDIRTIEVANMERESDLVLNRLAEKEAEVRRLVEDVSTGNAILAADVVRQYQRQLAEAERTIERLKAPLTTYEVKRPFASGTSFRERFNVLTAARAALVPPAEKEGEQK